MQVKTMNEWINKCDCVMDWVEKQEETQKVLEK